MAKHMIKQFKIKNNLMQVHCGTMNRLNPMVLYIDASFWITPTIDMDYKKMCDKCFRRMAHFINTLLCEYNYDNRILVDYTINSSDMKTGQSKYATVEIMFKQKTNNILSLKENSEKLYKIVEQFSRKVNIDFKNDCFTMSKNKGGLF